MGEKPNDRAVIDRVIQRQIGSGVPADKAIKDARDSMRRIDRDRDERRR
jgi:hypothetical protein